MVASSESQPMRERVVDHITQLQDAIVTKLESYGSERFRRESWTRDEGGGGLSCTFPPSPASTDARIDDHPVEKAGVNISTINGVLPPAAIKQMSTAHAALKDIHTSLPFAAAGLGLIIHSRHPRVPAVHANYRYFEVLDGSRDDGQDQGTTPTVLAWWFGVITDLTPAYVNASDFGHFHNTLKIACDTWISSSSAVVVSVYPTIKTSCDDYLYIPHRHEHRGIGGVRFDDMDTDAMQALLARGGAGDTHLSEDTIVRLSSQQALFSLVKALGDSFLPSFTPILERRIDVPFIPSERRWQLLRRGRAVEFNLVVDRGTKFGLAANNFQTARHSMISWRVRQDPKADGPRQTDSERQGVARNKEQDPTDIAFRSGQQIWCSSVIGGRAPILNMDFYCG